MWYFLVPYSDEKVGGQWPVCNCSRLCEGQVWGESTATTLASLFCFWPFCVGTATVSFLLVSWMLMCLNDGMIAFWGQALRFGLSWYLPSVSVWILVFDYFLCKPKLAVAHQLFWWEEISEVLLLFTSLPLSPQAHLNGWIMAISLIQSSAPNASALKQTPDPYPHLTYLVIQDRNLGDTMDYFLCFISASISMFNQSQSLISFII